jgi:hypothetical protein
MLMVCLPASLLAGPIGGVTSTQPVPVQQQQEPAQTEASQPKKESKKTQQTQAKVRAQSQQINQQAMTSRQAAQRFRQSLNSQERRQFDALAQLAPKAVRNSQANRQFQAQWGAFVQEQARKGNRDIDAMTQAVMHQAWGQEVQRNQQSRMRAQSEMSQQTQLQLQDAMNRQQQAMQMLSNMMKASHDTAKAVIRNMR